MARATHIKEISTKLPSKGVVYMTHDKQRGKFYIGKDTKNRPDYFGSGVIIRRIAKVRPHTLEKIILAESDDYIELEQLERQFIKQYNAVEDPNFYNFTSGGDGGSVTKGWTRDSGKATPKQLAQWANNTGNKYPNIKRKRPVGSGSTHKGMRHITKDGKRTYFTPEQYEAYIQSLN